MRSRRRKLDGADTPGGAEAEPGRWASWTPGPTAGVLAVLAVLAALGLGIACILADSGEAPGLAGYDYVRVDGVCSGQFGPLRDEAIRVLFLLDTSSSMYENDPGGTRATATVAALDDLAGIVDNYRAQKQRQQPDWTVYAAIDNFSDAYNRLSGDWLDLADFASRPTLGAAPGSALLLPHNGTNYLAGIQGAFSRFAETASAAEPTCDLLFWLTDAEPLAELTEDSPFFWIHGNEPDEPSGFYTTYIKLQVDHDSTSELRRRIEDLQNSIQPPESP